MYMGSGDGLRAILIVLVFLSLYGYMTTTSGLKNIQDNWPLHRCNPTIMPFAGYLSPDGTTTTENLSYCIQNSITSFSPTLLQPYEFSQSINASVAENVNTSTDLTQQHQNNTSFNVGGALSGVFDVFVNVVILFNVLMVKLNDTQGKLMSIVTTVMHLMTTTNDTFGSMWNGIPGQMLRDVSSM